MKNVIKRTVCAALTAVSLSACVVVPSALNTTASKTALVNSIEAEAAFSPFYGTISILGTSLRDRPNGRNIAKLWQFTPVYVTDETRVGRNYWYKVKTPDGEGWVNGRYVDKCSTEEYIIRSKFAEGKRIAFVTARKGIGCKKSPSMNAASAGTIWFMGTAEIERIWPTSSDGIVWAQLTDGSFLPLTNGKSMNSVDLMTKEQAARMRSLYY
jgi:hypothetical protein